MNRLLRGGLPVLMLWACSVDPPAPAITAHVELTGGTNPGVYDARSLVPGCSRDLLGKGSWGIQLSDWSGPKSGLRSLQLVVPRDTAGGDSVFYLGMVFGDFFAGTVHEIETRHGAARHRGSGRVTIGRGSDGRTVAITGLTSDGVAIAATIECQRLTDPEQSQAGPKPRITGGRPR
jgi:hypothetical protein